MIENWFLGFFEADGSFTHGPSGKYVPALYVGQQDDMGCVPPGVRLVPILLGGTASKAYPRVIRKGYPTPFKPQWKAFCRSKDALLEAVWFFDQHPLISARKQRDYQIWRKMVMQYIMNGRNDNRLPGLAAELSGDGRTKNQ